MKEVKYICLYANDILKKENRYCSLAARNKIDYICEAINEADTDVNIISVSWSNNKNGFYAGNEYKVSDRIKLKTFNTFGGLTKAVKLIKYIYMQLQLIMYLLFKVKKGEEIIVYSSPSFMLPIAVTKFIKGYKLILEVEEVYYKVFKVSNFYKYLEDKVIESADKFIFANDKLNEMVNKENKPFTIIYGSYKLDNNVFDNIFKDEKTHLVYAGVIDKIKLGAFNAVNSAKYLSDEYVMHILGTGQRQDVEELTKLIDEINLESKCKVIYEGNKDGIEYNKFLKSCHIGLSTQKNEGEYLLYTFPSKILSYMGMNLRVVSAKVNVVEMSKVNEAVDYYKSDDPRDIATCINEVKNRKDIFPVNIIKRLDREFIKDMGDLLKL